MVEAELDISSRERIIREVFIEPIRTVIVIDDEFPTIDSLVAKAVSGSTEPIWKADDLVRVQKFLEYARSKSTPWLVDIHDANKIRIDAETRIAPYLDHSDLMILDYHLDGDDGGGDASIRILRQLAENGHHNLVILYTKGYADDIHKVLREIAVSLTFPDKTLIADASMDQVASALEEWDADFPGTSSALKDQVTTDIYLHYRPLSPQGPYTKFFEAREGAGLLAQLEKKPVDLVLNKASLLKWLFWQRQQSLLGQMAGNDTGPVGIRLTNEMSWLRTDRLFLTIVLKTDPPTVFEDRLSKALVDSFPTPHRLLVAKMRAVIDVHGTRAENAIIANRAVQTAWLDDFLADQPADENSTVLVAINRHWEAFGDNLKGELNKFSVRLRAEFLTDDKSQIFRKSGLDQTELCEDETLADYNLFISTKPFDRSHLTTGHVFHSKDKQDFWICLSPACDIVPGQKASGWIGRLGKATPFNAFRLWEVTIAKAAKSARTNHYLFFRLDDKVKAFSIYREGNTGANPEWEVMFAANSGVFDQDGKLSVTTMVSSEPNLTTHSSEVTVFAQLRAEYSLNLLQRVGAFLFRPGLGMYFKGK